MELEKSQTIQDLKSLNIIFVTLESNASTWEHRVSNFSQLQIEALLATVHTNACVVLLRAASAQLVNV